MSCRLVVSLFVLCALTASTRAGLVDVTENNATGDVTFTIDFGHAPDLADVDAMNRPDDAFEIQVAPNNVDPMIDPVTVIRSDEVQFGSKITVRDAMPADLTDPHAGGWGPLRGSVPFTVKGNDVSFTASLKLMGLPNGMFDFATTTSHFGDETAFAETDMHAVPLPSSIAGALAILMFGLIVSLTRHAIKARRA